MEGSRREVQGNVVCGIKLQELTFDPEKRVLFRPVSMLTITFGLTFMHIQYMDISKLLLDNHWILKRPHNF